MDNNYDNVPITEQTKEGMSLTTDDQKWIKLLFDRQDECTYEFISKTYDLHAKLICDTVRDMLDDIRNELKDIKFEIQEIRADLKTLHGIAEENRRDIRELQKLSKEHDWRITHIENKLGI